MSASPNFAFSPHEDEPIIGLVPFPAREAAGTHGDWMPVMQAAPLFGVSPSTLRRALARARRGAPEDSSEIEGECRGRWFAARQARVNSRQQWQFRLIDRPIDVISQEAVTTVLRRIADFRSEHAGCWQEHPLDHIPGRRHWWQFWRSA
jgi:hypothetical protein